jgi:hypothetical protein
MTHIKVRVSYRGTMTIIKHKYTMGTGDKPILSSWDNKKYHLLAPAIVLVMPRKYTLSVSVDNVTMQWFWKNGVITSACNTFKILSRASNGRHYIQIAILKDEERCAKCGAGVAPLTCGKCKSVKYCTLQCQKDNWTTHKIECEINPS